jgi:two-component system NarL family response regulator
MNGETIRVLVADDHPIVREGLRAVTSMQEGMVVVAEAKDGREAVEQFRATRPDVALIDLRMPHCNGVEATSIIRREFPDSGIVVLTTYAGDEDVYSALRAGARGYLLKGCDVGELIAAIQIVHAGGRHIPPEVFALLAERFAASDLTAREREVLELIVRGAKNRAIATVLGVTEGTVKGHVNNILGKLGVTDRTQAATVAVQRGLAHLEDGR